MDPLPPLPESVEAPPQQRRFASLGALAAIVAVLMIILALSFQSLFDERALLDRDSRGIRWYVAQTEIELVRVLEALQGYAGEDPGTSKDEVIQRFELFWSRLPVLTTGESAKVLRDVAGVREFATLAIDELKALEGAVLAIDTMSKEEIRAAHRRLEALLSPLQDVTRSTLLYDSLNMDARLASHERSFNTFVTLFVSLFFGGAFVFWVLYRETTRAQRLSFQAHQAEEIARHAQHQLLVALENISQGFILYDADDKVSLYNSRFKELHSGTADMIRVGVTFEAWVREAMARHIVPMAGNDPEQWLEQNLREHHNPEGPFEIRLSDGRWLRIDERRMPDGRIVGLHTDVTEAKQREVALRTATIQAESASRAKTEFLARMSHELRTPLNAIIGFSEMIGRQILGPVGLPRYVEYANDIARSSQHLLGIISDVLDISKIEAGRIQLQEEAIDVGPALRECAEMLRPAADREGVIIAVNVPAHAPALLGDRTKIKQSVINLLSNSIKFSHPGSSIRLEASIDDEGYYRLAVSDKGIGIASEHLRLVLEPFGQVENPQNRRIGGTGLGLPIAKALVELHGGDIHIESTVGFGTAVSLRFPPQRILAPVPRHTEDSREPVRPRRVAQ